MGEKNIFFKKCPKCWPKYSQIIRNVVLIPKMYISMGKAVRIKRACTVHDSVQLCAPCNVHGPKRWCFNIQTTQYIYIFGISTTFLMIWEYFGQYLGHFLKKIFFSPKGPPFDFWALKNQKNPNFKKL